jgi:hypothetical protein
MEGREDQKPNLSRHRAFSEDVINGFHCLIAEEAFFTRIQAVPPSPVPSPMVSFESEPKKDFHLERALAFGSYCTRLHASCIACIGKQSLEPQARATCFFEKQAQY